MRLVYELTENDTMAFFEHRYATSPALRKSRRRSLLIGLILAGFFVLLYFYHRSIETLLIWTGVAIAYVLFAAWHHRWQYLRNAWRLLHKGKAPSGPQMVVQTMDNKGLHSVAGQHESHVRWRGIEQVVTVGNHTFVYIGSNEAYPIPKRGVREGDYETFIAELKQRVGRTSARS